MEEIKGYKAFNANRTNRYGKPFKEGETYSVEGKLSFGNEGNGYHMATNLSDVFRYFDSEDCSTADVTGFGDYVKYDDEYNGYYDMYVVRNLRVDKFLERREIIRRMLECVNVEQLLHFFQTFKMTDEEKLLFARQFRDNLYVLKHLIYYQFGFKEVYSLNVHQFDRKKLEKVILNGQNSDQRSKGK